MNTISEKPPAAQSAMARKAAEVAAANQKKVQPRYKPTAFAAQQAQRPRRRAAKVLVHADDDGGDGNGDGDSSGAGGDGDAAVLSKVVRKNKFSPDVIEPARQGRFSAVARPCGRSLSANAAAVVGSAKYQRK